MNLAELFFRRLYQDQDLERERLAQQFSQGNGYQGTTTLADLMSNSPKYGLYMNQLREDDAMRNKDDQVLNNIRRDVGEPPSYFDERFWLNQNMQALQKSRSLKYKGGI